MMNKSKSDKSAGPSVVTVNIDIYIFLFSCGESAGGFMNLLNYSMNLFLQVLGVDREYALSNSFQQIKPLKVAAIFHSDMTFNK